jgi:NitT/TauT family transport system ATP-binding protein
MIIKSGAVTSVVGPSGSGKTTLFDLLSGVIEGSMSYHLRKVFPKIGYIMHDSALMPWRTIMHNYVLECKLRRSFIDLDKFRSLIARCELDNDILTKPARELSFGMRQRAELARALAFKPDLLILDEGLSGLNRKLKLSVFRIILDEMLAQDMAIIITSHFLTDIVRFSDRIYLIREGVVLDKDISITLPITDRLQLSEMELFQHAEIATALASLS